MAARKAMLSVGATGTYLGAVYLAYQYIQYTNDEPKPLPCSCSTQNSFSYVQDPHRTNTFQRIAKSYDDQIQKDEFVMGINLLRRSLLYFHSRGDVLEVGAGTGRNISFYPSSARKIVMTDSSDRMLHQARQKLESSSISSNKKKRFEIKVADASHLSSHYDENSFDTVVDTFGLCSFDDPVKVLMELRRVCRPDGKILLLEHGRTKKYEGLSGYLDKNAERHAKNWGCVWNRDIDNIVKEAGLVVEKLDTWHFGTTYYIVCRPGKKEGDDESRRKGE